MGENIKDEIKIYMLKRNSSLTDLAKEMNMSTQNLNNKLTKGTIRYTEIKQIADILKYDIKWIPVVKINDPNWEHGNIPTNMDDAFIEDFKRLANKINVPLVNLYSEATNYLLKKYLL